MKKSLILPISRLLFTLFVVALPGCSLFSSSTEEHLEVTFEPQKDLPREEAEIGPDEENVIGRAVAAKLLSVYFPFSRETLAHYVNRVGKAVAGYSERPNTFSGYSFLVVESKELNAFAAPGGYIFITTGLLNLLTDEDMLAAVFAHEISHVVSRHGLKAIKREHMADYTPVGTAAISAVDCSGVSQQLLAALDGAVGDIVDALLTSGYSKEQEYEADRNAVKILIAAGYDPSALGRVLEILSKRKGTSGGWFSTHPDAQDRLRSLPGGNEKSLAKASNGFASRKVRFSTNVKKSNL